MIRITILFAVLAIPTVAASRTAAPTIVTTVSTPATSAEPDAARMEAARSLVETLQLEQQIRAAEEKTIADGATQYDKYVPLGISTRLQVAAPKDYAVIRANIVGILADAGQKLIDDSLPIVVDAIIRRYAQHYSIDELKGLIGFYHTPLGQRMIAEAPGMALDDQKFQQGALKGIITAHVAETGPKVAAMLAPLLARAGITARPAGTPQPSGGIQPL